MREFITILEKYTENNSALQRYLKDGDFDPYVCWYEVCNWLSEHSEYDEDIAEIVGEMSLDDLREMDPEIFYKLPKEDQTQCAQDVIDYLMQHDSAEAPSTAFFDLRKKTLIPRSTWLIHFTNEPFSIAKDGFTYGIDQMDRLGLTTHFTNSAKKYGGYNFAFKAESREALIAAAENKYGSDAVIFQNSGVEAWHYGDEETQIIFWGKDVSPKDIFVITRSDEGWCVRSKINLRNGKTRLFTGNFKACVGWVIKNHDAYRHYLGGK